MGHPSSPGFLVLHALRIKGVANAATLAEITGLDRAAVETHLAELAAAGLAQFREARDLWQMTVAGREAHGERLVTDLAGVDRASLADRYARFLALNVEFKELCGDWQLRGGEPNDHADAGYDSAVIERLAALHADVEPVVTEIAERIDRFGPYPGRLALALARVREGDAKMFTGVMCGSYHDVWMELHEDLILTLGIDRAAEGSY